MLYVFLDCDGVINNQETFRKIIEDEDLEAPHIDNKNIEILSEFIHRHDAKVVLSSSWRNGLNKDLTPRYSDGNVAGLLKILKLNNIDLVGKTESLYDGDHWGRPTEIFRYVEQNLIQGDDFIIFDDDDVAGEAHPDIRKIISDHFVKTSFSTGLTEENIKKAERLLSRSGALIKK